MTEQELNSYRFSSGEEPTDEMLACIMKEVARDAKERQEKATSEFFREMHREAAIVKAKWADRINSALNG